MLLPISDAPNPKGIPFATWTLTAEVKYQVGLSLEGLSQARFRTRVRLPPPPPNHSNRPNGCPESLRAADAPFAGFAPKRKQTPSRNRPKGVDS